MARTRPPVRINLMDVGVFMMVFQCSKQVNAFQSGCRGCIHPGGFEAILSPIRESSILIRELLFVYAK